MLEEHKKLIDAISESTKREIFIWKKSGHLSYSVSESDVRFLLDKYYSSVGDDQITCINLTIFDHQGNIIDEIVTCSADDERIEDQFDSFSMLYSLVEKQFQKKASDAILPKLLKITTQIERNLH